MTVVMHEECTTIGHECWVFVSLLAILFMFPPPAFEWRFMGRHGCRADNYWPARSGGWGGGFVGVGGLGRVRDAQLVKARFGLGEGPSDLAVSTVR
jgi:hypothetical protein